MRRPEYGRPALGKLRKLKLVDICRSLSLNTAGTRPALIGRIVEAVATATTAPSTSATPLSSPPSRAPAQKVHALSQPNFTDIYLSEQRWSHRLIPKENACCAKSGALPSGDSHRRATVSHIQLGDSGAAPASQPCVGHRPPLLLFYCSLTLLSAFKQCAVM
jgi:hypothetical protein